jgi:hypothetical protein
MEQLKNVKTLLITGDVTFDWNMMTALKNDKTPEKIERTYTRICGQPGGVLLLAKLLKLIV